MERHIWAAYAAAAMQGLMACEVVSSVPERAAALADQMLELTRKRWPEPEPMSLAAAVASIGPAEQPADAGQPVAAAAVEDDGDVDDSAA